MTSEKKRSPSQPTRLNIRSSWALNTALKIEAANNGITVRDLVTSYLIQCLRQPDLAKTLEPKGTR